jgi:hypothetical protein
MYGKPFARLAAGLLLLPLILALFAGCPEPWDDSQGDNKIPEIYWPENRLARGDTALSVHFFTGEENKNNITWTLSTEDPFSSVNATTDEWNIFLELDIREDLSESCLLTVTAVLKNGSGDSKTILICPDDAAMDYYYIGTWQDGEGNTLAFSGDGTVQDSLTAGDYSWDTSYWGRTYLYDDQGRAATGSYLYREGNNTLRRTWYETGTESVYIFRSF